MNPKKTQSHSLLKNAHQIHSWKLKKKNFHNPNQIEPQIKWFVWKEGEQEKLKKENIARVSCQVGGAPESQSLLTWKLALEFSSLVHHCSLAFHIFFLKLWYGMVCIVYPFIWLTTIDMVLFYCNALRLIYIYSFPFD